MLDPFSPYKTFAVRQYSISKKRNEEAMQHIAVWSEDNIFILDILLECKKDSDFFLYHLIDFSNGTGLAGHSFGGCAATNTCYLDQRFSCVLSLDGAIFGKYLCGIKIADFPELSRKYLKIEFINRKEN